VRGYELTARGKIIIAALLVAVFTIILALAPIAWRSSRNTTPDDSLHDPVINQNDTDPTPADSEQDTETVSDGAPVSQNGSHNDTAVIDNEAGIMTFQFTPATQTSLDESTISMIGELVTSPKYTEDSMIAVEIPQLTDEDDAVTLSTAIIEALTSFDVPLSDIVFYVYQAESGAVTFEIKISLTRQE